MKLCTICQKRSNHRKYHIKEMMFGTGIDFEYTECPTCGVISLVDPPVDMKPYYPDHYYSYVRLVSSPKWKYLFKQLRLFLYYKMNINPPLYGEWLKLSKVKKHHKIADIGCGNGQILYELYACGYQHLEGFDPFIEKDVVINGALSLYKKDIFEITSEGTYDMIMMNHAFEHMDRPQEIVNKAYDLLKPGGLLLIRIPVADGQAWQDYGVNWVQLDAPRHLYIHSTQSMAIMAEIAKFKIESVVFDSTAFQFWGSELYKSGISLHKGKKQGRFSSQQLRDWKKQAKIRNLEQRGDQACFYLRK